MLLAKFCSVNYNKQSIWIFWSKFSRIYNIALFHFFNWQWLQNIKTIFRFSNCTGWKNFFR
jgi:hypothetical protein